MISWSMLRVVRWSFRLSPRIFTLREQDLLCLGSTRRALCLHGSRPAATKDTSPRHVSELSIRALADLGFTDTQAEQVLEGAFQRHEKKIVSTDTTTVTTLLAVGLNPATIVKILNKCPALYQEKGSLVEQRIQNLWKLGLVEGSIQRVVSHYPHILIIPTKKVNATVHLLRTKCLFTAQHVRDIIRDSPEVVDEDLLHLEYKFQYAYFRIGVRQPEMVKSCLFRVSMEELRWRHCFLERRGFYQTPDKKGQTLIVNPKLKDFLWATEEVYLAQYARATKEELDVFRRLMAREDAEGGRPMFRDILDVDAAAEELEDEEEEEAELKDFKMGNMGKRGYVKTKRKK